MNKIERDILEYIILESLFRGSVVLLLKVVGEWLVFGCGVVWGWQSFVLLLADFERES